MLDYICLHIAVQLTSGNLVVLIGVRFPLHPLYKEIAEHSMFGFLQWLGCLASAAAVITVRLSGTDCLRTWMAIGRLAISISVPLVVPE